VRFGELPGPHREVGFPRGFLVLSGSAHRVADRSAGVLLIDTGHGAIPGIIERHPDLTRIRVHSGCRAESRPCNRGTPNGSPRFGASDARRSPGVGLFRRGEISAAGKDFRCRRLGNCADAGHGVRVDAGTTARGGHAGRWTVG